MTKANSNLHAAKKAKNDEFYTKLSDIENEMNHYNHLFKDKVVYLNCDSEDSKFWLYFKLNFEYLGIKKVIAVHFSDKETVYKLELTKDGESKEPLSENGDFRSSESIGFLQEADYVITNPPFSLFREYIDQLVTYNKKFIVVGSMNAISYKEVFPFIKEDKLWLGVNPVKEFTTPDGSVKKFGNICWFTNVPHSKRNEELFLFKEYSQENYPTYDNYDAIEVSKVADIPEDYKGVIGVPITFLTKYNPNQFEIVKFRKGYDNKDLKYTINGVSKQPYFRILVKRK